MSCFYAIHRLINPFIVLPRRHNAFISRDSVSSIVRNTVRWMPFRKKNKKQWHKKKKNNNLHCFITLKTEISNDSKLTIRIFYSRTSWLQTFQEKAMPFCSTDVPALWKDTSTWVCLFLLVTECSTAYCTKQYPCSMHLLCFLLGPEPMDRQANPAYAECKHRHTHTCTHV